MIFIGVFLVLLGILFLYLRRNAQGKLLEMKFVKTSSAQEIEEMQKSIFAEIGAGGFRQQVEMKGVIRCDAPMKAELSGEQCVYFSMNVEERFEETYTENDSQGRTQYKTRTNSTSVAGNTQATRFYLEDSTGKILVASDGAQIDAVKVVDRFEPYQTGTAQLRFGNFSFQGSMQSGARKILGYHYRESILPLGKNLYVIGEVSDAEGMPLIHKPQEKGKPFIISLKSEEELTKGKEQSIVFLFYAAIASVLIGAALIIAGAI